MSANNPPFYQKTERAHSLPDLPGMAPGLELVDLLSQYSTQPELLKLILQSKLQEDKRKTEETRLRSMQIDLMIYEQSNQQCIWPETEMKRGRDELFSDFALNLGKNSRPRIDSNPFSMIDYPQSSEFPDLNDYTNYSSALTSNGSSDTASPPMIFSTFENEQFLSPNLVDSSPTIPGFPNLISQATIAPAPRFVPDSNHNSIPVSNLSTQFGHPKPDKKKRNRKAMLPISMIIETKEFPYPDNFVWLNNGNTIQKKTGLRSTYYKCANWHKGCSVNKTVSSQGDGTYIIKYRGEHLPECGVAAKVT
ncbi:hypothetical protein K7432_010766 [Basidiobolus ranarum]|uniref:WRKY domain-containing protein n=1 Tax=Basidiobolus ranarum TaxID=34480 RepID=A0ABR2VVF1_9FUNG